MKRSASSLEEAVGCGVVVPATAYPSSPLCIPHAHYAMIYIDIEGKVQTCESKSIQEQDTSLFTPEVIWNFLGILNERLGYSKHARQGTELSPSRGKRPTRTNSAESASEKVDSNIQGVSNGSISLEIGETQNVMAYYRRSLECFQQLDCSEVAKEFIKFIEPRKQVKHPYSGKRPIGSGPGTPRDPENTKPEWWPPGVVHKEPDHLKKDQRIKLLLHIICKLGDYEITAEKLMGVVGYTKQRLTDPSYLEIINEILRVRKAEEEYERQETDGSRVVYIRDRNPMGDKKDNPIEPASAIIRRSKKKGQALPITVEGLPSTQVYSPPGLFSMPVPLMSEINGGTDHSVYNMPTQCQTSFSQPVLDRSMTSGMTSSHDARIFNYSVLNPLPASTYSLQHTSTAIHATFYQDVVTPAAHGSPERSRYEPFTPCPTTI